MTIPAATWSYASGVLTHTQTSQSVTIDIAANPALHQILSAQHWRINPTGTGYTLAELKADYRLIPEANWVERRIRWNRATEDPPVLAIEQTIGAGDYRDYTVYLLEDAPDYSDIFTTMAAIHNDMRVNGSTPAHERAYMKNVVRLMQKAGIIGEAL